MTWNQVRGQWRQVKGSARARWSKLSDEELDQLGGDKEVLIAKLQERYGLAPQAAEDDVDDWLATVPPATEPHPLRSKTW